MNVMIKSVINNNFKHKLTSQLEYLQEQTPINNDQITLINNILQKICSNTEQFVTTTENDTFNDETQMYMYNKEWNKLANIHKIIKIKEHFKYMADTQYKRTIICKLEQLIMSNKLKSNEQVVYDRKNQKIIDIPVLKLQPSSVPDIIVKE